MRMEKGTNCPLNCAHKLHTFNIIMLIEMGNQLDEVGGRRWGRSVEVIAETGGCGKHYGEMLCT